MVMVRRLLVVEMELVAVLMRHSFPSPTVMLLSRKEEKYS